jgi:predicted O-linked N-acetylglucosamine transferase (SPINDLY family)
MCNFNRAFKLEPLIMRTWLDVLARAPTALLWLFSWDNATEVRPTLCSVLVPQVQRILSRSSARPAQVQRNILRFAEAERGRAVSQRIHFTPMLPAEHQGVLKGTANLFVDTPQYNAHGTLTEVLSVGMPVVTLPLDKSHASRVAASILVGMQRTELIARTLDDYACICADLAASVRRRATVERSFAQSSALAVAAEAAWIGQIERAWRHLSDLSELPGAPRHLVLRSAT